MKAKSLKKLSDDEKIRLKKSKSSKRKRSYSSDSSDSGRKKPCKSKKSKKKSRKRPRQPSISPTSSSYSRDYSVSSCSTCEKRKAGTGKSKVRKGRVNTGTKQGEREVEAIEDLGAVLLVVIGVEVLVGVKDIKMGEREERARILRRDDSDIVSSKDEESKIQRGEKESEPIAEALDKVVPEKASSQTRALMTRMSCAMYNNSELLLTIIS